MLNNKLAKFSLYVVMEKITKPQYAKVFLEEGATREFILGNKLPELPQKVSFNLDLSTPQKLIFEFVFEYLDDWWGVKDKKATKHKIIVTPDFYQGYSFKITGPNFQDLVHEEIETIFYEWLEEEDLEEAKPGSVITHIS